MTIQQSKKSYPLFQNTFKERKNILEGYESKKYLNKTYSSKSKRNLRTRDGNKLSRYNAKKQRQVSSNNVLTELCKSLENNMDLEKSNLTKSIEERYCNIPSNNIDNHLSIALDKFIINKLDKQLENEWTVL